MRAMSMVNTTGYCTLLLCLLMHSFSSTHVHAASSSSSASLCDLTPHPAFCRSQEPSNKPTNIHDFGRSTVKKALTASIALSKSINRYLNSKTSPSSSSQTVILALEDCQFLLDKNIDILSSIAQTLKDKDTLDRQQYEDLHTQFSATITDKQTCIDGLIFAASSSSSIVKDISPPLSNGSMLCSISLAFFKHGWAPPGTKSRSLEESFPLSSSSFSHRKLLQLKGVKINQTVTVNPNGSGNYITITDAILAAPNDTQYGQGYYLIRVAAGIYQEYINIASNKKYLMMVGDGINQTIITGNHSVDDGWTTFSSATFVTNGQSFIGVNLTIRNTAGAIKHQAVALRNDADFSVFYQCSFEGYQDTLYTHTMRQFYRECDIYGTVDYIFGDANVVFQHCNIYSRLPLKGQTNTVTAQGKTDINQNTGTTIHDCKIKAADDLLPSINTTKTYLGRPWKNFSTTIVMESFMDTLINPAGWLPWNGSQSLDTLYYAEYNNTGPGSNTTNRVTWPGYHIITNGADVLNDTVSALISGDFWLPSTGVPYTSLLLYYP
ncbi:OLC1v1002565C1 [Oldenlandia corymbosa var. corymbosa]|uniref:Pectinesterase n=1 Tax=Oldenlandia corymbosa var. corymbosa TaxID=529605 RepID=A0AAV1D948_OLDCO|nr:OLC1v1002565C1 [Oldenlandia corymbosa var. corymbosa]